MEWRAKVELFEEIRREYEFGIGTVRGVARKLGVHRRQVRLGQRAACFMDSLTSLGIPATGYGLRDEYGQGLKAYYSVLMDRVTLPPRELFLSVEEEACTSLHELSHLCRFLIMPPSFVFSFCT
jgi:carbohydrate phosphorylase